MSATNELLNKIIAEELQAVLSERRRKKKSRCPEGSEYRRLSKEYGKSGCYRDVRQGEADEVIHQVRIDAEGNHTGDKIPPGVGDIRKDWTWEPGQYWTNKAKKKTKKTKLKGPVHTRRAFTGPQRDAANQALQDLAQMSLPPQDWPHLYWLCTCHIRFVPVSYNTRSLKEQHYCHFNYGPSCRPHHFENG